MISIRFLVIGFLHSCNKPNQTNLIRLDLVNRTKQLLGHSRKAGKKSCVRSSDQVLNTLKVWS